MDIKIEHIGMGLGALVLAAGFVSNGGINNQGASERAQLIQEARFANSLKMDAVQVSEQHLSDMEKVAIERYQRGCLFVVASQNYNTAVSIIENQPVLDWATGAVIPDETVVCGFNGTTAVVKNGVAALVAFTGNTQVIENAKLRAGFEGSGSTVQGN